MARIDAFLKLGLAQGCSDVHLAVGVPPMLRLHGDLMPIKFRDLGDSELETYIAEILTESQTQKFNRWNDIDFSYVSEDGGRFRVNVFRKATGVGATFRNIPNQIPSLESLELPDILRKFCDLHQGMVLVTGSTGTGTHDARRLRLLLCRAPTGDQARDRSLFTRNAATAKPHTQAEITPAHALDARNHRLRTF
jgi:twitching motility protein PilT